MIKFTCVADLHFHDWKEFNKPVEGQSINLRNWMMLQRLQFLTTAESHVVVLGDIVQRRSPLVAHEVIDALDYFKLMLEVHGHATSVIAGNHDFPENKSGPICAANHLAGVPQLDVHTTPFADPEGAAYLPWDNYTPEELRKVVKELRSKCAIPVLFTHFPTKEAVNEFGKSGFGKYSVKDFCPELWDVIVSGDIHKPQSIGNFHYTGSSYQLNRGEAGNVKLGYLTVHEENGKYSVKRHVLTEPSMRFIDVVVDSSDFSFDPSTKDDLASIIVKRGAADLEEVAAKAKAFFTLPPTVTWERDQKKQDVLAKKHSFDPNDPSHVLSSYMKDRWSGSVEKEELEPLALDYLTKCAKSGDKYTGPVRFTRILADNFMIYKELDAPLDDQGVVLIDGINSDAPGVWRANAVGKSTMIEAIKYALFKKTSRELPETALANEESGKDSFRVQLHLETSAHSIVIDRYRNYEKLGSGVTVYVDEEPYSSAGRTKDDSTQAKIEELTGITPRLFDAAVLFGQNVTSLFAAGTDKDRKEILSEVFPVDIYVEAEGLVDKDLEKAKADVAEARKEIVLKTYAKSKLEADIAQVDYLIKQDDTTKAEKIKQLSGEKAKVNGDLAKALTDLQLLQGKEIPPPVYPSTAEPDSLVQLRKNKQEAQWAKNEATLQIGFLNKQKAEWANLIKEGHCPTCREKITKGKFDAAMAPVLDDIAKLSASFRAMEDKLAALTVELSKAELDWAESQRQALVEFNKLNAEYSQWKQDIGQLTITIDTLTASSKDVSARLEELKTGKSAFEEMQKTNRANLKVLIAELKAANSLIKENDECVPYLEALKVLFGKQGLRTYVFDYYIKDIVKEANLALETLTDGIIQVSVPLQQGTTGKESFAFTVSNSQGSAHLKGQSGAERRAIDLACLVALFRLLNRINILSIDEALDVLDDINAPRVFNLFVEAAEEKGVTVFCITHRQDIKPLCSNVWTVVKSGKSARIVLDKEV